MQKKTRTKNNGEFINNDVQKVVNQIVRFSILNLHISHENIFLHIIDHILTPFRMRF